MSYLVMNPNCWFSDAVAYIGTVVHHDFVVDMKKILNPWKLFFLDIFSDIQQFFLCFSPL